MDISAEDEISRAGKKKSAVVFDNVFCGGYTNAPKEYINVPINNFGNFFVLHLSINRIFTH
jgi:hypothetical protein